MDNVMLTRIVKVYMWTKVGRLVGLVNSEGEILTADHNQDSGQVSGDSHVFSGHQSIKRTGGPQKEDCRPKGGPVGHSRNIECNSVSSSRATEQSPLRGPTLSLVAHSDRTLYSRTQSSHKDTAGHLPTTVAPLSPSANREPPSLPSPSNAMCLSRLYDKGHSHAISESACHRSGSSQFSAKEEGCCGVTGCVTEEARGIQLKTAYFQSKY